MFPPQALADNFGPGDAEYSWSVFEQHRSMLVDEGFPGARKILEVGPGRNLGTALLWWASLNQGVTCWDVFANADVEGDAFWPNWAMALLSRRAAMSPEMADRLEAVASRGLKPDITYLVTPLTELARRVRDTGPFDLVYSHAAIEHVWSVDLFWETVVGLSAADGWHSHRIDMADHGRRDTNYIELLEWSATTYWLMMRYIPGSQNRWRAVHHLGKLQSLGMSVLAARRTSELALPIPLEAVSRPFRQLGEDELRTVAIDIIARKAVSEAGLPPAQ